MTDFSGWPCLLAASEFLLQFFSVCQFSLCILVFRLKADLFLSGARGFPLLIGNLLSLLLSYLFILLLYYISFVFTRRLYCFLKCAQNNFLWVTNEVITVVNRTHQFAFIDTVHTFFWDKTVNFECIFKQVYDEYRLITVSKDFFQYYV